VFQDNYIVIQKDITLFSL